MMVVLKRHSFYKAMKLSEALDQVAWESNRFKPVELVEFMFSYGVYCPILERKGMSLHIRWPEDIAELSVWLDPNSDMVRWQFKINNSDNRNSNIISSPYGEVMTRLSRWSTYLKINKDAKR